MGREEDSLRKELWVWRLSGEYAGNTQSGAKEESREEGKYGSKSWGRRGLGILRAELPSGQAGRRRPGPRSRCIASARHSGPHPCAGGGVCLFFL